LTLTVVNTFGDDALARVFVAETVDGARIEFVESVQPPVPREKKWVLIVSTLKGCSIQCPICDAGGSYNGRLSREEILSQIAHLVARRFPGGQIASDITKIQFARMGDPAFNPAVIEVLRELPRIYPNRTMPSISTVAPKNCASFIDSLKQVKDELYSNGMFQMQFSIHTTDDAQRRTLIPAATLPLSEIRKLGDRFFDPGDRKITLNFAAVQGFEMDAGVIARHFSPEVFIIKLTPVNPTFASQAAGLEGVITEDPQSAEPLRDAFRKHGFDVIVSIGEMRENQIGSNCGMYVAKDRCSSSVPH
jgi:23S rRNA (adenine2503-C2)-methyltransferase